MEKSNKDKVRENEKQGSKLELHASDLFLFRSIPSMRIASAFLILFGSILVICVTLAKNREDLGIFGQAALILAGILIIAGGIALANASKSISLYFSRLKNEVKIVRKGWFTSRTYQSIPCAEISAFEISKEKDSDGDSTYQLNLNTKYGQSIAITDRHQGLDLIQEQKSIIEEVVFKGGANLKPMLNKAELGRRIPASVKTVILVICLWPFVALYVGEQPNVSKPILSSEQTTAQHLALATEMSKSTLKPGEEILWVGQPEPGREAQLKLPFVIPFAIIWTLFCTGWTCLAWLSAKESRNPLDYLMPLFGLSFVVVGIGLLSIPYFSRNQALNTVYALTDRCAIRITDGKPCRLVEYKESDFGPIEVTRYKNNRADVLFIKDSSEGDKHPYGGFYGISNADIAIAILRKHCHQPDNF